MRKHEEDLAARGAEDVVTADLPEQSQTSNRRDPLWIHLGCGEMAPVNWVNFDRSPSLMLSRVPGLLPVLGRARLIPMEQASGRWNKRVRHHNVENGLPFPNDSVDAIYSSHMLEHLPNDSALALLRECRRVIKSDGIVRMAVPDLEALIVRYNEDADANLFIRETFMGVEFKPRGIAKLVRLVSAAKHKWLYDEKSLERLFREAGFAETARCGFHQGRLPELDVIETREGSLFMEAYPVSSG